MRQPRNGPDAEAEGNVGARRQLFVLARDGSGRRFSLAESPTASPWGAGAAEKVQPAKLAPPIFVSYSTVDRAQYVEPLVEYLRRQGFSVWADWRRLGAGDPFEEEIEQGLRYCAVLIAVVSNSSVGRKWPLYEWRTALRKYFAPVVPFVVEEDALEKLPDWLRHLHHLPAFPVDVVDGSARFGQQTFDQLQAAVEARVLDRGKVMIGSSRSGVGGDGMPALAPMGRAFIGREDELQGLVGEIGYGVLIYGGKRPQETVIVHGVGGIGKSMLAAELARRIGPRYPGGVIVERRGRKPDEDLSTVLCKWSEYLTGNRPAKIEPVRLRRQMEHAGTMLVILDDVWENDGETVRVLCNEALPLGTDRIVTTRDAQLRTRIGGKLFPLDRLSCQDGVALLRERLWDAPPPTELLERLWQIVGGHALALELVAGRILFSCLDEEDLKELDVAVRQGDLSEVARETVENPDKEMSVAVNFDLSWKDLVASDSSSKTRLAPSFARLGVFAAEEPFDIDAAAAVWGVDRSQAKKTLAELTRRALLNHLGKGEYTQHPLVHSYALGRLREEDGAEAVAARRHLDHYRGVVAAFDDKKWRQTERWGANITTAGAWAAAALPEAAIEALGGPTAGEAPEDFDAQAARDAMEFALAAHDYVWKRRVFEGRRWLMAGLAGARLLAERRAEAFLLTELGVWHNERGKRVAAKRCFQAALALWEVLAQSGERDDRYGLGRVLTDLGIRSRAVDKPKEALELYRRALRIRQAIGDREGEQIVLGCIGVVHRDLGQHEEAIGYYRQSLAIAVELGDLFGQSVSLNNLGRAYRDLGRLEEAVDDFEQAIELAERCGNDAGVAINRNNLGCVHYDQGRYETALSEFEETVPIREAILDDPRLAVSYHNVGLTLRTLRRTDEALAELDKALKLEAQVDDYAGRASTLFTKAGLLLDLGRPKEALDVLEEAERTLAQRDLDRTSAGTTRTEIRSLLADWRSSEWTAPVPTKPI